MFFFVVLCVFHFYHLQHNAKVTFNSLSGCPAKDAPSQYRILTLFQLKKSMKLKEHSHQIKSFTTYKRKTSQEEA